ncbi:hypothetical protein NM688_g7499 [Phlebia brevispora]|uniref:Uncharacterized protein n=1 Tax=Phlebia brevispora TaxID=194682 RepID=A0ACC1S524_9APHY|nr:hypothetical protein NM688_g7499 [Phlebia brevispora]
MIFAEAATGICAVGTGFKFVGNTLEVGLLGTFQVCNEQIYFAKTPGPTPVQPLSDAAASCVNVTIEKPTVATAVPLA